MVFGLSCSLWAQALSDKVNESAQVLLIAKADIIVPLFQGVWYLIGFAHDENTI